MILFIIIYIIGCIACFVFTRWYFTKYFGNVMTKRNWTFIYSLSIMSWIGLVGILGGILLGNIWDDY